MKFIVLPNKHCATLREISTHEECGKLLLGVFLEMSKFVILNSLLFRFHLMKIHLKLLHHAVKYGKSVGQITSHGMATGSGYLDEIFKELFADRWINLIADSSSFIFQVWY